MTTHHKKHSCSNCNDVFLLRSGTIYHNSIVLNSYGINNLTFEKQPVAEHCVNICGRKWYGWGIKLITVSFLTVE